MMKCTIRLAAVVLLAGSASSPAQFAAAQSSDVLRTYRFITSRSRLEETVGNAGPQPFFAHGTFDLVTGLRASSPEADVPHAAFVDVDSMLFLTTQLTDQKLNLSGLSGTFSPEDPSRLVFHGFDGQNQPFSLTAVQRGRLLHLSGENDPACCGFIKYKFDALAFEAPYSDFNLDGSVDDVDASLIVANMGARVDMFSFELGDADGNGMVNGNDYLTWQREIGAATAMSEFVDEPLAGFGSSAMAVPEPATAALAILCLAPLFIARRRTSDRIHGNS
jgi:hypothetical protein